jgi:hypothetical protein
MKKNFLLFLSALLVLSNGSLHAGTTAPIDTNALALLKRMSTTLANAKAFSFRTDSILEVPHSGSQFITVVSKGFVEVERPNKIRAVYGGDAHAFDFFYDGSSVTAVAPLEKVYSTAKAPDSIDEMLSGIHRETGIHFHSAPLLFSDSYRHLTRNLRSAVLIGPTTVRGIPCDHLAFRSTGVNWEIWISSGPVALPYRLAATFTDRPNFPRKFIDLSGWNLHPRAASSFFSFNKPKDYREVPFGNVLSDARQQAIKGGNH